MSTPFRAMLTATLIAGIGAAAIAGGMRSCQGPNPHTATASPSAVSATSGTSGTSTTAASPSATTSTGGPVVQSTTSAVIPQFGQTTIPSLPLEVPFATCQEAKDAGRVPLRKADPRFNPALDPDGNGIACE